MPTNKDYCNALPKKVGAPCLSRGTRGPKPKISRYKIFNYILSILHGDGSNTVAKKGGTESATLAINISAAEKPLL